MTPSSDFDTQVIIVGGGPVGLGLAITLGQRGIRSIVVERTAELHAIPKGQNLTQRTMEHFYFWSAEKKLREARTVQQSRYGIGGLTTYGTLLGRYNYDWLQRELVRPYYFTDNERLPQYATEGVLRQRVSEIDAAEMLYGWKAEAINQDEDGVRVEIASADGAQKRTLRAQYVVGCDGSRSLVRERAGITQTKLDHDRLMVLLVFRSAGLDRLLERFPGKSYYNALHPKLGGYWQFFGRVDMRPSWFFHAPVPVGTTRDNFDFPALLHNAVGADFEVEFDYIGFWDLRIALADTYRKGRVFIAGDAAHSHPPYGGYGVNSGFEDAVNLGWKLAATLKGWAGDNLLDSYDEERRPVFHSTARDFIAHSIKRDRDFLQQYNPAVDKAAFEAAWAERKSGARLEVDAFEPNYEGASIVCAPSARRPSAVGAHDFAARAGHHLAPQPLSSGANVFEALAQDFTLLAFGAPQSVVDGFRQAAETLKLPLKIVEDTRADEREAYKASLILVRPDQFVAWAADDASADPLAILKQACGYS